MSLPGASTVAAPAWLIALQAQFLATVTKPLGVQRGVFEECRDEYPAQLLKELSSLDVEARVALYHRQYWMRLFSVLQGRFPRFATAAGHFHFNQLAALHLATRPLRQFDVERCGDGFFETLQPLLASKLDASDREPLLACVSPELAPSLEQAPTVLSDEPPVDWLAALPPNAVAWARLFQALQFDECVHRVFLSPLAAAQFRPTTEELARMPGLRFTFAPGVFVVSDNFDLLRLPESGAAGPAQSDKGSLRTSSARRAEGESGGLLMKHWLLHRSASGISYVELSAEFARFLQLIRHTTFGQALLELEQIVPQNQQAAVETALPGWIQYALEKRLWIGAR